MSFLTDLFEGHTSNLGTDLAHAGSSLMSHPSQMWETIGGIGALATGGLALGALAPEAGAAAGGAGLFGDLFGGGGIASAAGADSAALDAVAAGAAPEIAPAVDAASTAGADSLLAGTGIPGEGAGVAGSGLPGAAPMAGDPGLGGGLIGPPAPSSGGGGFLSGITDPLMHPTLGGVAQGAGVLAAGAGLGMNALRGSSMGPNQQALTGQAAQMNQQGMQLESYLKHGTLPPALKAQLKQATDAEKARITAGYAAKGMPTDPNMNSALAQELNNVDTNAVAAMADVQMQMFNTGLKETGMSTQIYEMLTKMDQEQNQQLMQSIASFAAALGGGPRIQLPAGSKVG